MKLKMLFFSRKSWTLPYLLFSAVFVVIPLLLIVVYAFTNDVGELTLANFTKFFGSSDISSDSTVVMKKTAEQIVYLNNDKQIYSYEQQFSISCVGSLQP